MLNPETDVETELPEEVHLNDLLDEALMDSFPASDPVSLWFDD